MGRGSRHRLQVALDQRRVENNGINDRFADVLGTTRGSGRVHLTVEQEAAQEAAARDELLQREVDADGNVYYFNHEGNMHRETGPAVECIDGELQWHSNDKLHRDDGPALERADGLRAWYQHDELHREDGPAIEGPNGRREWWLDGRKVREEDVALVTGHRRS